MDCFTIFIALSMACENLGLGVLRSSTNTWNLEDAFGLNWVPLPLSIIRLSGFWSLWSKSKWLMMSLLVDSVNTTAYPKWRYVPPLSTMAYLAIHWTSTVVESRFALGHTLHIFQLCFRCPLNIVFIKHTLELCFSILLFRDVLHEWRFLFPLEMEECGKFISLAAVLD